MLISYFGDVFAEICSLNVSLVLFIYYNCDSFYGSQSSEGDFF